MMAGKARLFGDSDSIARILANPDPSEAKKGGRKVRGFDEEAWNSHRYELVVRGNVAKSSTSIRLWRPFFCPFVRTFS